MRDIKFREWDPIRQEAYGKYGLSYGDREDYDDMIAFRFSHTEYMGEDLIKDRVVEQYTGLKDVNGVEIYEGDVLQPVRVYPDFLNIAPSKIGKAFLVKSGNYVFGKWIARLIGDKGYSVSDYYFGNELNIIGNIHEQPELLEDR